MSVESRSNTQIDLGHWLIRLIALIIDSIPLSIIAYAIFWLVIVPFWFVWLGWVLIFPLLYGILALLYFIIMEVTFGATIGKKILGLEVQMTNGGRVTSDKSFIRNISKLFWILLFLDWLVAIVTPGPDPRQKYTDRIAGTTVVSIKQVFGGQPQPPPPPPPPPPEQAQVCPTCGGPLRYIEQYQRWYCDREKKYV
jgi:uncharacterized RDD family membrane protein YckC